MPSTTDLTYWAFCPIQPVLGGGREAAHMLVLMCMRMCTYVLPTRNKCENASDICVMYVRVCICVCLYVCLYVCVRSLACACVCVRALTCIYAAFTHVSSDVYYMRTIHVRPYKYVAYDDYVLAPCRAERAGSRGPQGSALAAASSALRRLHTLQLFLM